MPTLTLKPPHKAVAARYESLAAFETLGTTHELAVQTALAAILKKARKENPKYAAACAGFVTVCRGSLNPNLSAAEGVPLENPRNLLSCFSPSATIGS